MKRAALLVLAMTGAARAEPSVRPIEARAYAGVHTSDYATVNASSGAFVATRASLGATFVESPDAAMRARVDGLFGHLSPGDLAGAAALRLYAQTPRFLLGASYGHTRIGGLEGHLVALHGEVYETSLMTVTSSFGFEKRSFGDDLKFGEVFLRFYVGDRVVLTPGASYAVTAIKQTRADVILRAEWTFLASRTLSLAAYAQYGGNIFTRALAGLTLSFDGLPPVRRERRDGLTMARFD